jgi:hypothetical protein
VTNSGLVILKRHWWSLCRKKLPVTDVIIKYIPMAIGKLICTKDKRDVYIHVFNTNVATVVSLTVYTSKMDLLDYVYREYAKACLIIEPEDIIVASYEAPLQPKLQSFKIPSVFKSSRVKTPGYPLSEKISKLKSRIRIPDIPKRIYVVWDNFLFA